jgi:hypothetical protein
MSKQTQKPMEANKSITDFISEIKIDRSNLEHIAKTGKINGSLFLEIQDKMRAFASQELLCAIPDYEYNKKEFGRISEMKYGVFMFSFAIEKKDIMEDGNKNCKWRWVDLKNEFHSIDEAKKFVIEVFDEINKNHTLHYFY